MTPAEFLRTTLSAIDWNEHVRGFLTSAPAADRLANSNRRIALWVNSLLTLEPESPARSFLYGMQSEGHYVAALIPLALYKPAASSMRAAVEAALYYSYFRHHPMELGTLLRDSDFFIEKAEIIEFHKKHTPDFTTKQQALNFVGNLTTWYSRISGVIHGQIPGAWTEHTDLSKLKPAAKTQETAITEFETAVGIINALFLVSISQDEWNGIPKDARQELLKNLSGPTKKILGFSFG
jgi:hypothetical protein